MEELGIAELSTKQMEILCQATENSAKNYILSRIPQKKVEELNIIVEAYGERPLTVKVEVDIILSPKIKDMNPEPLTRLAVTEALKTSENFLRKINMTIPNGILLITTIYSPLQCKSMRQKMSYLKRQILTHLMWQKMSHL